MNVITGVCRFCGCTPENPCIADQPAQGLVHIGQIELPNGLGIVNAFVCGWLNEEENLCSSPACVHAAYREATARVEQAESSISE